MRTTVVDRCPDAEWCDQGTRPHTQHEGTLGTWHGHTVTSRPMRPMTFQVVVHGYEPRQPTLFVAVIDSATLEQAECELSWQQVAESGWTIVDAASRWRVTES